ncbi:MAG: hypothetical protein WBE13_07105, partial [Candidatus Acidiferrum sp.]
MATNLIPPLPNVGQYFPILCKGAPTRSTYAGPPEIEANWHKAMEEGRHLESSINGAMFAVQKEKADLEKHIMHYLDLIQTSADSEFRHGTRKFKLAADILNYIQKIQHYMSLITGLTQAIQSNLNQLAQLETDTLNMLSANLAALAAFMSQVCNLGLPSLPSIPSFFGANIFTFNGFGFAGLSAPSISFAALTNFSFAQCSLVQPNGAALDTPPTVIMLDGVTIGSVAGNVVPPLGGQIGNPNELTSPSYITAMQNQTTPPVYNPTTINPATILVGSLPDPAQIISAYQMPQATYKANVLATVPAFQSNPPASQEYTLLSEYVSLVGIVNSNYDKNLTAAWLYYIEAARLGRGGQWLPNFEAAYQQYIQPSIAVLENPQTLIPWNTALGGSGTVDAPTDIPLVDTLTSATPAAAQHILWQLSYIEASLLGYIRTTQFDSGVDSVYLATFTLNDLDYTSVTFSATDTVTLVLGATTATYPVNCVVPKALVNVLNEVIAIAAANIAANQTYVTNRPQFRYTYNAFAEATQVDRFTQFWRTFNYNFQQLLTQDPYVVGFVAGYAASLDSAVDPLGTTTDSQQVENDALTRNRAWAPGQPLLPLPVIPTVTVGTLPGVSGTNTGWSGSTFNPQSFLSRPDVQSLPLPVQYTMLRTNESYAALMTTMGQFQDSIDAATAQGQAALASIQNNGFNVTSSGPLVVKNAVNPLPVSFDATTYD